MSRRSKSWLETAVLILITISWYGICLSFPYTNWDDRFFILENSVLRLPPLQAFTAIWHPAAIPGEQLYIPLTYLSFWLEHLVFHGWNPAMSHAINLALHLSNVLLLFTILGKLPVTRHLRFWICLVFAVHPLQSEAVCWAMGRKDLLSATLGLMAMAVYLRLRKNHTGIMVATILAGCAVLAKPSVLGFFPLLLFCWWYRWKSCRVGESDSKKRLAISAWGPVIIILVTAGVLISLNLACGATSGTPWQESGALPCRRWLLRLGAPFVFIDFAVRKLCLLLPALVFHPIPVLKEIQIAFILRGIAEACLGAAALGSLYHRNIRIFRHAIAWLGIAGLFALPTIALIVSGRSFLYADRYLYLFSAPLLVCLFIMLAVVFPGIAQPHSYSAAKRALGSLMVVIFLITGFDAIRQWKNSVVIWQRVIAYYQPRFGKVPDNVWNCLGSAWADAGNYQAAHFAYCRAIALDPRNRLAWNNLAELELRRQRYDRAAMLCRKVLQRWPRYRSAWHNLALAAYRLGKYPLAQRILEQMLRQVSNPHPASIALLGQIYLLNHRVRQAQICLSRLRQIAPGSAWVHQLETAITRWQQQKNTK